MMRRAIVTCRGFTLIELSVSMAIIALLTTLLLADYPETATRLTLVNNIQSTALLIREAQLRGSAVDTASGAFGGYGVYLSLATPNQVLLFADSVDTASSAGREIPVGNGLYESGLPLEEASSYIHFSSGFIVSKLCTGTGYPFTCNEAGAPGIETLTISFIRPNPLPNIYVNGDSATSFPGACIELRSPRSPRAGHIRSIQVLRSGVIRTIASGCDAS